MDYFEQYAKTLPQPLDSEVEKQLLIKYYETKDEAIRQTLLEHNLLLCLKVARAACFKYNCPELVDQTFSVCYEELANSLDKYDPHHQSQAGFSTFAINNMKLKLIRAIAYERQFQYQLVDIVTINKDEKDFSLFQVLYDDSESHIAEDSASNAFVEDIVSYIDTLPPKKKEVMQMYLGIDYPRRYTQVEIAKILGNTRQNISLIVNDTLPEIQKYISLNYELSMPNLKNKTTYKPLIFTDIDEEIFNDYYGVNSTKILSHIEIIQKYKLNLAPESLRAKIYKISEKLIKEGKYTQSEIDEIKSSRTTRKKQQALDTYAQVYFSCYAENGYTQKSRLQLSNEFHVTVQTIDLWLKEYKKYLNSLSPSEREAEIAKHSKQLERE